MKPTREHATNNTQTYFVTSDTWERRALFHADPWARLFFKTLLSYRAKEYLLHELVLMPDHFHLLITPSGALEHAVQLIKGGFSFRAKHELGSNAEVWQRGFSDHRIRDSEDYDKHVHYIHLNPVKRHLCEKPEEYAYSSAYPGWRLDPIPRGLKPSECLGPICGTAEAVPFQSLGSHGIPTEANDRARQGGCVTSAQDAGFNSGNLLKGSISSDVLQGPFFGEVLKGHGFSRAIHANQKKGALAPEGGKRCQ